jgi:hypothetical protein
VLPPLISKLDVEIGTPGSIIFEASGRLIGSGFGVSRGNILFEIDPANGKVSNIRSLLGGFAPQGLGLALSDNIITIAGNGTWGYGGDGGPALNANFNIPSGVAADSSGNVFIADTSNHRVRKVDIFGTITTVAGTRTLGYNGDNIPAASAQLTYPTGVAVDNASNLFIAEHGHRIRKVDTAGFITTVAGTGINGYKGDNISATNAMLRVPTGVAVDSNGNIYIADSENHRVRKVNTSGIITTVAGTGTAGYNGDNISATSALLNMPHAVCVDSAGNLYIAERIGHVYVR